MELTRCPDCAAPAEILWRAQLDSTDGPVEHGKLLCLRGHHFLMPIAGLSGMSRAEARLVTRRRAGTLPGSPRRPARPGPGRGAGRR